MAGKVLQLVALSVVLAAGFSCGGEARWDSLALTLTFLPRELPPETESIRVYVLPARLPDNSTVGCKNFVGPARDKDITDYSGVLIETLSFPFDQITGATFVLTDLPEGLLVFFVDALNSKSSRLARGCGQGVIVRGRKTVLPIRLESAT